MKSQTFEEEPPILESLRKIEKRVKISEQKKAFLQTLARSLPTSDPELISDGENIDILWNNDIYVSLSENTVTVTDYNRKTTESFEKIDEAIYYITSIVSLIGLETTEYPSNSKEHSVEILKVSYFFIYCFFLISLKKKTAKNELTPIVLIISILGIPTYIIYRVIKDKKFIIESSISCFTVRLVLEGSSVFIFAIGETITEEGKNSLRRKIIETFSYEEGVQNSSETGERKKYELLPKEVIITVKEGITAFNLLIDILLSIQSLLY